MSRSEGDIETSRNARIVLDRILTDALELDGQERADYLEKARARHPALQEDLAKLLAASLKEDPLLRPGGGLEGGLLEFWATNQGPQTSKTFGPYRTLGELGRGGMGIVYLAERVDGQFEQKVAIKVIHSGASGKTLERFAQERQILANLHHPNIARLLDGGATEDGHPYLVMEVVDGLPIDRYCSENELPLRDRLELLRIVCDAVLGAHRQLVVHRDIKPSNVLVTSDGRVKLVDFGIASLAEARNEAGIAASTLTGAALMTPQYASPEQYRGHPITVASDIYQLGLLSYEVLSGRRPYDVQSLGADEAVRQVCEVPPLPPLAKASKPTGEVGRETAREVNAIVLKALRKDPGQRYPSVHHFKEDIERFLAGQPVSARPLTLAYRTRMFVNRNAPAVTLACFALATILIMAVGFTVRLLHERDNTQLAAERADRLRVESQEVTDFLIELFEIADPSTTSGETVTALELLNRGTSRIDTELEGQPLVRGRLLQTMATIHRHLGLYDEAGELYNEVIALREEQDVPAAELAESLEGLGRARGRQARFEEAEALLLRALQIREVALGGDDPSLVHSLQPLALVLGELNRTEEGVVLLERAVKLLETQDEAPRMLAVTLDSLGLMSVKLGEIEKAGRLHDRSIALFEEVLGTDHHNLAGPLTHRGSVYSMLGQYEESLPFFERSHAIQVATFGPDHIDTTTGLNNLAIAYMELHRYEEARRALEHCLAVAERVHGVNHPLVGNTLLGLGNVLLAEGRPAEAAEYYRHAVANSEEQNAAGRLGFALTNLAEALVDLGDLEQAEVVSGRGLEVLESVFGSDHLVVSWPVLHLARIYHRTGRPGQAEPFYRRALNIRRKFLGPEVKDRVEIETAWVEFLREEGRPEEIDEVSG